ncbi:MAG: uroporphyrinogen decarboxylase [Chloroflexi bacterium]|nr:uroporphyrinogen decarboxylase [Chloroflexota bacterium]
MLTHRERLQATLKGEKPDRPPIALWRHFPVDDQTPEGLAAATIHFQRIHDFDLVKVTPASSFCLKDWGIDDEWQGNPEGTRRYTKRIVQQPQDWERLPALAPSSPHLAGQLACLRLIRAELGPETPIIQTIFSPLAQAKNLAGGERLLAHIRKHPEAVQKGLETIAATTRRFIEAMLEDREIGIDGLFYAVQHAQAALLSLQEYQTFGLSSDQTVLEPAQDLWCNLLHLHGSEVYFELVSHFPVQIVNWHDRETPPSLAEAARQTDKVLCGGLSRQTMVLGSPEDIRAEAQDALSQTGGRRFILGTGCVVPIVAPYGNIRTLHQQYGD